MLRCEVRKWSIILSNRYVRHLVLPQLRSISRCVHGAHRVQRRSMEKPSLFPHEPWTFIHPSSPMHRATSRRHECLSWADASTSCQGNPILSRSIFTSSLQFILGLPGLLLNSGTFSLCFLQCCLETIGWEDYTLVISFVSNGFPTQRPDWRVIYRDGLLYVFPTRYNIVNFLINLTATYLSKARYSLFWLKVPLNPNQSLSRTLRSTIVSSRWFMPVVLVPVAVLVLLVHLMNVKNLFSLPDRHTVFFGINVLLLYVSVTLTLRMAFPPEMTPESR